MANAFKAKFKMELAETVETAGGKNKRKKLADVDIPTPILADFGITAEQAKYTAEDEKENKENKAGEPAFQPDSYGTIPVYTDPRYDWLQGAVIARVQQQHRNLFVKGELKPGLSLKEDFESLTAESARTGEALALRREARTDYEAFMTKLGKQQATVQQLGELFYGSAKVLASADKAYVDYLGKSVGRWVEQLDEAKAARFAPKIQELQESLNSAAQNSVLADMQD